MASKLEHTLRVRDDKDGTELTEGNPGIRMPFMIAGQSYEIDLTEENCDEFISVLEPYMKLGRKKGKVDKNNRPEKVWTKVDCIDPSPNDEENPMVARRSKPGPHLRSGIRRWAAENGFPVTTSGRVSKEIEQAYDKAMGIELAS